MTLASTANIMNLHQTWKIQKYVAYTPEQTKSDFSQKALRIYYMKAYNVNDDEPMKVPTVWQILMNGEKKQNENCSQTSEI